MTRVIKGVAKNEQGRPLAYAGVEVLARGLADDVVLTKVRATANGYFEASLADDAFPKGRHLALRLGGAEGAVHTSRTLFNPPKSVWLDVLTRADGSATFTRFAPSEFTRLSRAVRPRLNGRVVADLEETAARRDFSFLAQETASDLSALSHFGLAHRLARAAPAVPAEAWFAFLRQGVPEGVPDALADGVADSAELEALVTRVRSGLALVAPELQRSLLERAAQEGIVERDALADLDPVLGALGGLRTETVLDSPLSVGKAPLRAVLDASTLPPAKHAAFAEVLARQAIEGVDVWEEIAKPESGIAAPEAADLRLTLEVGGFVKNHPPAIGALKGRLAAGPGSGPRPRPGATAARAAALARLTDAEWEGLLKDAGDAAVPDNVAGENVDEKRANFATEIRERVEQRFATTALVARAERSDAIELADGAGVRQVLDPRPELDLRLTSLDRVLNPSEGERPAVSPAAVRDLQRLQRVLKLAPTPAAGEKLLAAGLDSGLRVYEQGRSRFVEQAKAAGLGDGDASLVYRRAQRRYAGTVALFTQLSEAFTGASPTPLLAPQPPEQARATLDAFPTLRSLFGSLDMCDCPDCQTVHGPAAYLVDLLRWLRLRAAIPGAGRSVKDVLFARRPDLAQIALTCANTSTELPVIDLACELMERAVVPLAPPPAGTRVDPRYQSSRSAEELRAEPEHLHEPAYAKLATAFVPFALPFDLYAEQARAHLAQLSVERWRLMETCQGNGQPPDAAIAAENFGLPEAERAAIVTEAPGQQAQLWAVSGDPVALLGTAAGVLDASGLDYAQLERLIACGFVRAAGPLTLFPTHDDCAAEHRRLDGLTVGHLDRMHRLLRLWRRTRWELWELDVALAAPGVGAGRLDDAALAGLWRLSVVRKRLGLPLEELLAFYGPIATVPAPGSGALRSLYERLFAPTGQPSNAALALGEVGDTSTEPLLDYVAPLRAAFGLTEEELRRLVARTDGFLTLPSLSTIFRHVALARSLGVPVRELVDLLDLMGPALTPFASPQATRAFLDALDDVRASGLSLGELRYALAHDEDAAAGLREDDVLVVLRRLGEQRRRLAEELGAGGDPARALALARLATRPALADEEALAAAAALVEGASGVADPVTAVRATFAFVGPTAELEARFTALAPLPASAPSDAVAAREAELDARWRLLLAHLGRLAVVDGVVEMARGVTGLDAPETRVLLDRVRVGGVALLQALTADALLGDVDAPADAPSAFRAVVALHKAGLLARAHGLREPDLGWLLAQPPRHGILDLGSLPTAPDATKTARFAPWRALLRFTRLAARPTPERVSARALLDGAPEAMPAALARLTGWDADDVATSVRELALDHRALESYERIERVVELARATGVPAARLFGWARRSPTSGDAAEAAAAVRARSGTAEWLGVSGRIQDGLRERRRDALVAYLLAHPEVFSTGVRGDWDDLNDVLEHLLVDVGMGADQATSRIRQAISSVQLFVQRCLLNLEPEVRVDSEHDDEWLQWEWMKSYRVWEANRKVFLFPENWLWPEQRPDKSELFAELEETLMQGEISDERAERALAGYVEGLHAIRRPEVMTLHHDERRDRLDMIARTRNTPKRWLHRWRVHGVWSPWKRIELDPNPDQVVLGVHDGRLHLFWLLFTERADEAQAVPTMQASQAQPPPARKYWEIQLCWSEYGTDGWSQARVSDRKLIHPWPRPQYSYLLRCRIAGREQVDVNIFLTTSPEFNERQQIGPDGKPTGQRVWQVKRHNEGGRAWHSSQFVFRGDVADVCMNDRRGRALPAVHSGYGLEGRRTNRVLFVEFPQPLPPGGKFRHGMIVAREGAGQTKSLYTLTGNFMRRDTGELLRAPRPGWRLAVSHQDAYPWAERPFVYQDDQRSYVIDPELRWVVGSIMTPKAPTSDWDGPYHWFHHYRPLHHPLTALLGRELQAGGADALYARRLQIAPEQYLPSSETPFTFHSTYAPAPYLTVAPVRDVFDFSATGAYAGYNWELFLHAPLLIALRLAEAQRYEDALKWLHRVFNPANPTGEPGPHRFWITKPLWELSHPQIEQQRIENILLGLTFNDPNAIAQVDRWRRNPFQPHLIAAVRPAAYQRNVVMRYLDTLLEWGDALFRRDTVESINEATQFYVMASDILGPRPRFVPPVVPREKEMTYALLEPELDAFGNAIVDAEGGLPIEEQPDNPGGPGSTVGSTGSVPPAVPPAGTPAPALPMLSTFYFKIPPNQQLLGYWDRVEDALGKIRRGENIAGARRALELFGTPVDPGALVKAVGEGASLEAALAELTAPVPAFRFPVVLARAKEMAGEVRALGGALLAALEKADGEELALLRATQEARVLRAMRTVRETQVTEAKEAVEGLKRAHELTEFKRKHYENLAFMTPTETAALEMSSDALLAAGAGASLTLLGGVLALIPGFQLGASGIGGSPHATVRSGGEYFSKGAELAGSALQSFAGMVDRKAAMTSTRASYERRSEEWTFQQDVAAGELIGLDRQILAAEARVKAAERELAIQELQIDHARVVDETMRSKFSNRELYQWMARELRLLHTSAYRLAGDLAKRAERCFRFELGDSVASFVSGAYGPERQGLLAGDDLLLDLQRMDAAYLDRSRRDLEIVKHVSLADVDPVALLELKSTGSCLLSLPETLFDRDHPGHYARRIKSVAVTIPAVTGPYTSVNCRLSLARNLVRVRDTVGSGYPMNPAGDDRFVSHAVGVTSIVTSGAREDTGMFEPGLRDERYLPFEGAGAISDWRIDLPQEDNAFDLATVSDVVLHLRFTARHASALEAPARAAALGSASTPRTGMRLFSVRHEFPDAWQRFLAPVAGDGGAHELTLPLAPEQFPFATRGRPLTVTGLVLAADGGDGEDALALDIAPPVDERVELRDEPGRRYRQAAVGPLNLPPGALTLRADAAPELRDLYVVAAWSLADGG